MKYKIEITETLQRQVDVEAINSDEAFRKVISTYRKQDIVLDSNDYVGTNFKILEE